MTIYFTNYNRLSWELGNRYESICKIFSKSRFEIIKTVRKNCLSQYVEEYHSIVAQGTELFFETIYA